MSRALPSSIRILLPWGLLAQLCACQIEPLADATSPEPPPASSARAPSPTGRALDAGTPAFGGSARTIVTWNLQWFLDPERGPSDDARQLQGARNVLAALRPDAVALQEVSSPAALDALLEGLPLRAVAITDFAWPQQLALLLGERLELRASRVLTELSSAGRAPLEAELVDREHGGRVIAIAVHAKAYADAASWDERHALAEGLHAYLQAHWPDAPVIVLGDLNDGLRRSIVAGRASPYASFVSDPRYAAPTLALEDAEPGRPLLDHVLASDELAPQLAEGAAERIEVAALPETPAASAISDHAPIRVTFRDARAEDR